MMNHIIVETDNKSKWLASSSGNITNDSKRSIFSTFSSAVSSITEWEDRRKHSSEMDLKRRVIQAMQGHNLEASILDGIVDSRKRKIRWLKSLLRLDPRYQILLYYEEVARVGGPLKNPLAPRPPFLLMGFMKAAAFTVWRPTSPDAICKMIKGEVTGKGLDIKGKSAKIGKLCGLVPFLQIHDNAHKSKVLRPPGDARVRVFFKSAKQRDEAMKVLSDVSGKLHSNATNAKAILHTFEVGGEGREAVLKALTLEVRDPKVYEINKSGFGLDVSQRAFFEVCITRQNISRDPEYKTGRPSIPAFQDMNSQSLREYKGHGPRAVVFQTCEHQALRPQSLVMAYEENLKVTPVASDFDCFTVGTRGVQYDAPLPEHQVQLMKKLVDNIEAILETSNEKNWTSRWFEVMKDNLVKDSSYLKSSHTKMPEYGYGDPKSYEITKGAVEQIKSNAVRHGAECFNYYFPQEIDDHFLLVSDDLEGSSAWKYVKVKELQQFLSVKIDEGFCCPLNLKWILADRGWKKIYDKMMASKCTVVQKSLDSWYPPESGIREQIETAHRRFPQGFRTTSSSRSISFHRKEEGELDEGRDAMNLGLYHLRRSLIIRQASLKLRTALTFLPKKKLLQLKKTGYIVRLDGSNEKVKTLLDDGSDERIKKRNTKNASTEVIGSCNALFVSIFGMCGVKRTVLEEAPPKLSGTWTAK